MPGGRPTKLLAHVTVDDEPLTVMEAIIRKIRTTGTSPSLAGRQYGVDADTIWKWIKEGRKHVERRAAGRQMIASEVRLCEFVGGIDRAQADYLAEQQEIVNSLARGGLIVGRVVEKVNPMSIDPRTGQPEVIERVVTTERTLPNARAAIWNLERKGKREGFAPRVELTGEDGGPIEVDVTGDRREEREQELLASIQAYKDGLDDGAARERERAVSDADA